MILTLVLKQINLKLRNLEKRVAFVVDIVRQLRNISEVLIPIVFIPMQFERLFQDTMVMNVMRHLGFKLW